MVVWVCVCVGGRDPRKVAARLAERRRAPFLSGSINESRVRSTSEVYSQIKSLVSLRLLLQVRHVNGSVSENATRLWRSARLGLSVAPDPPFLPFRQTTNDDSLDQPKYKVRQDALAACGRM